MGAWEAKKSTLCLYEPDPSSSLGNHTLLECALFVHQAPSLPFPSTLFSKQHCYIRKICSKPLLVFSKPLLLNFFFFASSFDFYPGGKGNKNLLAGVIRTIKDGLHFVSAEHSLGCYLNVCLLCSCCLLLSLNVQFYSLSQSKLTLVYISQ